MSAKYTVTQLRHDIADATRTKTSYVREAKTKENRFMALLNGINGLWKDEEFLQLLREEKLPGPSGTRGRLSLRIVTGRTTMSDNGREARQGLDIPIVKLVPRNERTVSTKYSDSGSRPACGRWG